MKKYMKAIISTIKIMLDMLAFTKIHPFWC